MAWSLNHDGNDNPDFEHQTFFIDEYQKHIPLTEFELKAIPWSLLWANYFRVVALTGWCDSGVEVPTRRIKDAVSDLKIALEYFLP